MKYANLPEGLEQEDLDNCKNAARHILLNILGYTGEGPEQRERLVAFANVIADQVLLPAVCFLDYDRIREQLGGAFEPFEPSDFWD